MSMRNLLTCFSAALAIAAVAMTLLKLALVGNVSAHGTHSFAAGEPGDPKRPFRVVEVTMTDGPGTMAYAPNRIEVKKGEQIKFVLKNTGTVEHEFLIDSFANNAKHKKEMEQNPSMDHHEANGAHVKPNATTEIVWRFTKAGIFEFACLIPGHYETGMKGTFIVR